MRLPFTLLTLLTLLACSCAPRHPEVVRIVDWDAPGWKGCTRGEVQEVWGDDFVRAEDAGSELLSYSASILHEYHGAPRSTTIVDDPFADQRLELPGQPPAPNARGAVAETKTTARFWFDERGRVVRYWVEPELLRSRSHEPPATCRRRARDAGDLPAVE